MGSAQASGPAILCLGFILYILFIHVKKILAVFGCGSAALCRRWPKDGVPRRVRLFRHTPPYMARAVVPWKTTLFLVVVNLFNHTNERCDRFNGYNAKTGSASLSFFNMFPILPCVGVV
jgi:hypothetical protein